MLDERKEMLGDHVISAVKTFRIRNRYHRLNGKNSRRGEHAYGDEFIAKMILTDRGVFGWGLATSKAFWNDWDAVCRYDRELAGKRVSELLDPAVGILDDIYRMYDFALHDLAGNILQQPVYRMIGNAGTNPLKVYDGGILLDDISPENAPGGLKRILEECSTDYRMGYRDFKLKIGRAPKWMDWKDGLKRDIEVTRLVRETYPGACIMVDANDAYTVEHMKEYVDAVADCGLYWIEEPFREDEKNLRSLKEHLAKRSPGTLIADGESRFIVPDVVSLARKGLIDIVQMDIEYLGFTEWRRLIPELEDANVRISPHNWGFGLKTRYTASLGAGYPLMDFIEGVIDETEGVITDAYAVADGKIIVPELPGFGMKLVWGQDLEEFIRLEKANYKATANV